MHVKDMPISFTFRGSDKELLLKIVEDQPQRGVHKIRNNNSKIGQEEDGAKQKRSYPKRTPEAAYKRPWENKLHRQHAKGSENNVCASIFSMLGEQRAGSILTKMEHFTQATNRKPSDCEFERTYRKTTNQPKPSNQ
jgi:hypothetical protein